MIDRGVDASFDWEHYEQEFVDGPAYHAQEDALSEVFATLQPDPSTILEVGPGLGRITRMALGMWPLAAYSAADVALAPLAEAERLSGGLVHSYHGPVQADGALGNDTFDLVIAIEVLLHIPPEEVSQAIGNLLSATRKGCYSVTCDWTQSLGDQPIRVQNYRHDYQALFHRAGAQIIESRRIGLQTIYLAQP